MEQFVDPVVNAAAGVLVWLLTSLLKRYRWPTEAKQAIAVVSAGVTALAVVLGKALWAGEELTLSAWREYATTAFAIGTLIYGILAARVPGFRRVNAALEHVGEPAAQPKPAPQPAGLSTAV